MAGALLRNIGAGVVSLSGALIWTKLITHLSNSGRLPRRIARKISHITTAPFFMLTWPLYSKHRYARLLAAAVPLTFSLRTFSNPGGDAFAAATTRRAADSASEKVRQAHGLAAYGAAIAAVTAAGWRSSAPAYLAVAALCFGDGSADVVGSAVGGPRLPLPKKVFWKRKTVPGTAAFVVASIMGGSGLLRIAGAMGAALPVVPAHVLVKTALASAAVELLPVEDNISVPCMAFLVSRFLLGTN